MSNVSIETPLIAESMRVGAGVIGSDPFSVALARIRERCREIRDLCAYAAERHAISIASVASSDARVHFARSVALVEVRATRDRGSV